MVVVGQVKKQNKKYDFSNWITVLHTLQFLIKGEWDFLRENESCVYQQMFWQNILCFLCLFPHSSQKGVVHR